MSLAVVAGMKNRMTKQNRQKSKAKNVMQLAIHWVDLFSDNDGNVIVINMIIL